MMSGETGRYAGESLNSAGRTHARAITTHQQSATSLTIACAVFSNLFVWTWKIVLKCTKKSRLPLNGAMHSRQFRNQGIIINFIKKLIIFSRLRPLETTSSNFTSLFFVVKNLRISSLPTSICCCAFVLRGNSWIVSLQSVFISDLNS